MSPELTRYLMCIVIFQHLSPQMTFHNWPIRTWQGLTFSDRIFQILILHLLKIYQYNWSYDQYGYPYPYFSSISAVLGKFNMAAKMAEKQAHGTRVGAGNKTIGKIQHLRHPEMWFKKMYHEGARKPPVPPLVIYAY